MDSVITKTPLGDEKVHVQIPTDRAKSDTKRSMVVGGITIDAANRPDMNMTKTTLKSIVVHRLLFLQILPKRQIEGLTYNIIQNVCSQLPL
ncbi:MAG: hypothetical protein WBF33_18665 [Candidatus Nitrosopolaris sp.]